MFGASAGTALRQLRARLLPAPHPGISGARRHSTMAVASSAAELKHAARAVAKNALRSLSDAAMAQESAAATSHLLNTEFMRIGRTFAVYVHCARLREVDTTAVLRGALAAGARVYVPRVQDHAANMHFLRVENLAELRPVPPFGILEPEPLLPDGAPRENALEGGDALEVVVLPGLAFDLSGRRLGRGGGYYDRFIAAARRRAEARGWPPPLLAALAFRSQVLREVPVAAHDERVDLLVTADGVEACSARGHAAMAAPPPL